MVCFAPAEKSPRFLTWVAISQRLFLSFLLRIAKTMYILMSMDHSHETGLLGGAIDKSSNVPAHIQVRRRILDALLSDGLKVGSALPSEVEIANHLAVSRMTANKAILGLVAEGWLLREKGRGTFVAERPAKALDRCVILMRPMALAGAVDDYYHGSLYWGIRNYFQALNIRVDIIPMDPEFTQQFVGTDDAVLIAMNPDPASAAELSTLGQMGMAVTILGSSWEVGHVNTIDSDNLLGAALAVNHLVELGHKRIAFVGGGPDDSNTVDRLRGFRVALKGRQLELNEDDVILGQTTSGLEGSTMDHFNLRLHSDDRFTAVFAAGPHLAMQILGIAQREGISVPNELSIVSYDDPSFLRMTYPPLTTVVQPLGAMAVRACEVVMQTRSFSQFESQQVIMDPALVVRDSSAVASKSISHSES